MAKFNLKDFLNGMNNTKDHSARFEMQDIRDNTTMSILAYISWLVLFPLIMRKDSKYTRFHCNQGLVLAIVETVGVILLNILGKLPLIGWIFVIAKVLLEIVCILFALLGVTNVLQNKAKELPYIGNIKIL